MRDVQRNLPAAFALVLPAQHQHRQALKVKLQITPNAYASPSMITLPRLTKS